MRRHLAQTAAAGVLAGCFSISPGAQTLSAQTPATSDPNANIVVEKPTYVSLPLEVVVNRPAAEVWKRIGKYCDIGEWLQIAAGCKILSGTDGELGAVRSVANEVLVGKSEFSYTYTQPVRARTTVQPLSRHARSATGDSNHIENPLHAGVRQLDASR